MKAINNWRKLTKITSSRLKWSMNSIVSLRIYWQKCIRIISQISKKSIENIRKWKIFTWVTFTTIYRWSMKLSTIWRSAFKLLSLKSERKTFSILIMHLIKIESRFGFSTTKSKSKRKCSRKSFPTKKKDSLKWLESFKNVWQPCGMSLKKWNQKSTISRIPLRISRQ